MSTKSIHVSVLTQELVEYLDPKPGQNFIDCTLGGGGHTESILKKTKPDGKVLAFEADPHACRRAKEHLKKYKDRLIIINDSYTSLERSFEKYRNKLLGISGIIFDLGLSSDQLDRANRGFSFKDDGPLDMRFDPVGQTLTASDIVMQWSESELSQIFREYGEEKRAKQIAKGLVQWRKTLSKQKQIKTSEFASAILPLVKTKTNNKKTYRIHPATRAFQALRIAVNGELENIQQVLPQAVAIAQPGTKIAVISFHSLEDRIVKHYFKNLAKGCTCPPEAPICNCDSEPVVKILTKKGIRPSAAEVQKNPRSRSAILRVVEKK